MSSKNIVIVESPAKARTIERFLDSDYQTKSSFGHIRDLPKKQLGVDKAKNFEPTYEISPDKKKVVAELKKAVKGATVWLASDEDREGEAIAWHVCQALGLDPSLTHRIVFHEITKSAIEAAIANPRKIDSKLVEAQQARRILDRLVGYELSPVLWKKVRPGLSAGRVQSVAVRLIVEREREIRDFIPAASFKLTALLDAKGAKLEAELADKLADESSAKSFLEACASASFKIASVEQKPTSRSPSPPFTTSTLQQEGARKLGYSVKQTMSLAQRLYENGFITYMRTDSTNLSQLAIDSAKQYLSQTYGANYAQPRQFQTKTKGAQEAHEAIRPTDFSKAELGEALPEKKLYGLIWRRALASQMPPAQLLKTEARIDISTRPEQLIASGEVVQFDGFMKVYGRTKDDKILPELSKAQELKLIKMSALEMYSRAAARYSEAALVKKLESLGIGRPSTYAPTISTIQDRGYIEKGEVIGEDKEVRQLTLEAGKITETTETVKVGADRGKLLPTPLAEVVTDFLLKNFGPILDYDFTANSEAELDNIADGKVTWQAMLKAFYARFHPLIEKSASVSRAEAANARELGKDPKTGKIVVARYGRYGPMLQLGEAGEDAPKDAKPVFAPLPPDTTLDKVTLEEALPMFKLPRQLGQTDDGKEILANIGPYGPYVTDGKQYVSLKDDDPLSVGLDRAQELLAEKAEALKKKVISEFGAVKVLNGPYGPYVTDGKLNARVPKDVDPKQIDEAKAKELLAQAPAKKGWAKRKRRR